MAILTLQVGRKSFYPDYQIFRLPGWIFLFASMKTHTNSRNSSGSSIIIYVLNSLSVIGQFSPVSTPHWMHVHGQNRRFSSSEEGLYGFLESVSNFVEASSKFSINNSYYSKIFETISARAKNTVHI
jgi:hypothetical protein